MIKSNVAFAQFVNSVMASERVTHSQAWLQAAQLKPDLNTLMLALGATRARIELLNEQHQGKSQTPRSAANRIDARTEFHNEVHDYMKKNRVDYDTADRACRRQFSNLVEIMEGRSSGVSMANEAGAVPVGSPRHLAMLWLPASTAQDVFEAAYEANGKTVAVIHPAKIFDGLVNFFMEKKNISHDAAIAFCKETFPTLWEKIKELAKPA